MKFMALALIVIVLCSLIRFAITEPLAGYVIMNRLTILFEHWSFVILLIALFCRDTIHVFLLRLTKPATANAIACGIAGLLSRQYSVPAQPLQDIPNPQEQK